MAKKAITIWLHQDAPLAEDIEKACKIIQSRYASEGIRIPRSEILRLLLRRGIESETSRA